MLRAAAIDGAPISEDEVRRRVYTEEFSKKVIANPADSPFMFDGLLMIAD